ncbi:universal stress protein [Frateuria sp. MAH-13]|uniref:Universal stress protein n=1 Tax=Frateuria flava TaxID=2821489 RepID=A0ABS4DLU9_9GAMM|nr:universal stress protein [Frateuria flava]MBP1474017.1 universal stress protein [Frateuria flava]
MFEMLVDAGPHAGGPFLQTVLSLARHVEGFACGFQVLPLQPPVALSFETTLLEAEEQGARARRDWWLAQCAQAGVEGEWEVLRGEIGPAIAKRSRLADLVCLEVSVAGGARDALSPEPDRALVQAAGPLLLVPSTWNGATGARVLVAWNGSAEAANAIRAALPLLAKATDICVLDGEQACLPGITPSPLPLQAWMIRHGIQAQWESLDPSRQRALSLADVARRMDADLLVMGAYGHHWTSAFGRSHMTQALLSHVDRPILLSH